MRTRVLIAMIVVAGLAGLTYYLSTDRDQGARPDIYPEPVQSLIRVDLENVALIEIRRGDSKVVMERAGENEWNLTQPLAAPADPYTVASFKNSLRGSSRVNPIDAGVDDLGQFGLKEPREVVRLFDGENEQIIKFGDAAPLGSGVYVTDDSGGRVYIANKGVERYLSMGADDFREKRVFLALPENILEVRLERGKKGWALSKRDGTWKVAEPFPAVADAAAIVSLLDRLSKLRADSFLNADEAARHDRSFRRPEAALKLVSADGPQGAENSHELLLITGQDGKLLARVDGGPEVIVLKTQDIDPILIDAAALADRRLLILDPALAQEILLQFKGGSIRLSRSEQGFRALDGGVEVDPSKVYSLLDMLRETRWVEPLGAASVRRNLRASGLDAPDLVATMLDREGKPLARVEVGREIVGRRGAALGDPPYVFTLEPGALAGLAKAPEDLAPGTEAGKPDGGGN